MKTARSHSDARKHVGDRTRTKNRGAGYALTETLLQAHSLPHRRWTGRIGLQRNGRERGAFLLEVVIVSAFLSVATLALASATISGVTLEDRAHRIMSEVATADNVMTDIRLASETDFANLAATYDQTSVAAHKSIGFANDSRRSVQVTLSLDETKIPGAIDLNRNGATDLAVDPAEALVLVADLAGSNNLRLRTVVFDPSKLTNIWFEAEEVGLQVPAPYGDEEIRGLDLPDEWKVETPVEPNKVVSVDEANFQGDKIVLSLLNDSLGNREPEQIVIIPNNPNMRFAGISLNGMSIFTPPPTQPSGVVKIDLNTRVTLAPGEGTLTIGDFYKDSGEGFFGESVIVTILFDDGSVASTVVIAGGQ